MPKRDFVTEHEDKSRSAFYVNHENCLEINSSLYRLPQEKAVSKWANEVPKDFSFTFKFWKEIKQKSW